MFEELKCIQIQKPYNGYPTNAPPAQYVTLDTLYKDGWWITEIFGSVAVIIKEGRHGVFRNKHPRFRMLCKPIIMKHATKKAIRTIQKIKRLQWEIYQEYMLTGKWDYNRIKKKWNKRKKIVKTSATITGDTGKKSLKNSLENAKKQNIESFTTQ